jgi:hypothetical protein
MLSPSLSDYSLNEQHYLFLSRSLNDLERLVEQHRTEQYHIFDRLINAGFMEPRIEQQETRRYLPHQDVHPHFSTSAFFQPRYPSNPQSEQQQEHPDLDDGYYHRQSLNVAIAELGTRENPIYVLDDDEVRGDCSGGHFIVDCTRGYQFDEQARTTGMIRVDPDPAHLRNDESGSFRSGPSHRPRF